MPARILKVDDLRDLTSPDKVAKIFEQLGYNASSEPIDVESLQLSARSAEAIAAYLIADQDRKGFWDGLCFCIFSRRTKESPDCTA